MTSLHYILIALGLGLVVLLWLYNYFQERRYRKQVDRIFAVERSEVSLKNAPFAEVPPDTRIEPILGLAGEDTGASPSDPFESDTSPPVAPSWGGAEEIEITAVTDTAAMAAGTAVDPEAAGAATQAAMAGGSATVTPGEESPLDAEIEYVARLNYSRPTPLTFAPLMENLRRISKPIRALGRRQDGPWEAVQTHVVRAYDAVEVSLLLADRSGPVSEVQLDTFCKRLHEFAAANDGVASCPDKAAALARAKVLDGFCAGVDMLIGLIVMAPEGATVASENIHRLATEAGLVHEVDGSYSLRDAAGHLLFTLVNQEGTPFPASGSGLVTRAIALQFDAPRVAQGSLIFDRMTTLAFKLAKELGGELVDDAGRAVTHVTLDKDRARLVDLYGRMKGRGIPAGGERALRLFA